MKRKILIISTLNPHPFWAGSEKLWFDLVNDVRFREAYDVQVLLAESSVTEQKKEELKKIGVRCSLYRHFNVAFLKRNAYKIIGRLLRSQTRILPWYREIVREKYDLVIFNVAALADLVDLDYAVSLCKSSGTPYWLLLQHGYEDFFLASANEKDVVSNVSLLARRFVFIAKRNKMALERAICQELPNAFHTVNALPAAEIERASIVAKENPPDGRRARLFNVGRFSPRDKAQHLILEVLSRPAWKSRHWEMAFIGISGFDRKYVEDLAAYFGLDQERLSFVSFTEDVFSEIGKCDLLFMPSLAEGTPFAMIEAMACGRPAVGTPVGGIPELIIDGETGWLSRTTDVEDVSEAVENAWEAKNEWDRFGTRARVHVEDKFNQSRTLPNLLSALKRDLG